MRCLGILHGVKFWFISDVSGLPIDPIFKGQSLCLTREDGTDRLARNVGMKIHSRLRTIPKQRRTQTQNRPTDPDKKKSIYLKYVLKLS
jgi:hypothetical protein